MADKSEWDYSIQNGEFLLVMYQRFVNELETSYSDGALEGSWIIYLVQ